MIHGAEGAAVGQTLGNAFQGVAAGMQQADEHKRTQALVDAAHRAMDEREAKRAAAGALGRAQASLSLSELGVHQGQPQQPKMGSVPEDQAAVIHPKTGLPDYRDPATLQARMRDLEAVRSMFPQTPEGDAAYGALAMEQRDLLQGHILDNQEAEAIDGLANMVHSMTLASGVTKDPVLDALNQEAAPRLKAIEDTLRQAKEIKDKQLRASVVQHALSQVPVVQAGISAGIKEAHDKTEALSEIQQYMDSLPLGDPGRAMGKDAQTAIAMGGDAKKIADEFAFGRRGFVRMPDGSYKSKEQAAADIQQQRADIAAGAAQQRSEQSQETNALKGRELTLKERAQQWKETHPTTPRTTNGTSRDVTSRAKALVESSRPVIDKFSGAKGDPTLTMAEAIKQARQQVQEEGGGFAQTPVAGEDLQAKFNAMSPADQEAYLKAAGINK